MTFAVFLMKRVAEADQIQSNVTYFSSILV